MMISDRKIVLIILILYLQIPVTSQNQKEIAGYYPNWQWYDRNHLVNAESISYEKYTVLNYAFFRPQADGTITSTDSWADENLLLGPMIWWPVVTHDSTKSLPFLAHQSGVIVLPSIGGWNDSYNFPGIAANAAKRQSFVSSCISLIEDYNFNGIDLDWEYPGYAPNGGTPADKQNFTLLLQDLRDGLDDLEMQNNKEYLMTSCFSADEAKMMNIEWENILPLVDMVNLMTYDFHGSWDPESNHNTPLYPPQVGNPDWCIDSAFTILTQAFNVPAEKINIGVAFYGKALANCTQLYGPHTGYDGNTFWEDEGQPLYYNIVKKMSQFTRYWDSGVKCPYLLGNSINTFVSYDDMESLSYKAQYVKDHNARGVIIWEITGDYLETYPGSGLIAGTPLLDTLHSVFNETSMLINLKLYLEGPFNGINMNTALSDVLPLSHPFSPPLPYFGNTSPEWYYSETAAVNSLPVTNIVDWILVELRDAIDAPGATSGTRIAMQAAFLLNDGSVTDTEGMPGLKFTNSIVHQLFIIVYHRNHIGIMSANPAINISGIINYDYTTGPDQVYGGISAHKQLTTGIWGMISGDGNGDGEVQLNDITDAWSVPDQSGNTGYLPSDFNMDIQSNNMDKNDHWQVNLGFISNIPE